MAVMAGLGETRCFRLTRVLVTWQLSVSFYYYYYCPPQRFSKMFFFFSSSSFSLQAVVPTLVTKTSIMLGLGETDDQVLRAMHGGFLAP
jgi:hypothetical protein